MIPGGGGEEEVRRDWCGWQLMGRGIGSGRRARLWGCGGERGRGRGSGLRSAWGDEFYTESHLWRLHGLTLENGQGLNADIVCGGDLDL